MAAATQQQTTRDESILDELQQGSVKPSGIEQDIKEMERRKRVEMIMNSQMFREELERIIEGQFCTEASPLAGLSALHQVTELLQRGGFTSSTLRGGQAVIPINDIRGVDALKYDKAEKLLRCKVAAVYRLVDLHGWSQNIYNHISARLNQELEHFLINPFGLQYNEITASSLVKIDIQGNLIDQGSTNFLFNRAGFNLHAAIHRARPDLKAIIHIHHPPVIAVSSFKKGLLPLCQEAAILGEVSYYDYTGILVDSDEQDAIAQALGIHNKVMILRNHGVVACGVDIEEAFFYLTNVVKACEVQVKLLPVGLDNLILMSKQAIETTQEVVKHSAVIGKDGDGLAEQANSGSRRKMNVKDLDFEAHMRMLDNSGYRTGYVYKNPLVRREEKFRHDVEEPPTVTSVQSNYFDQDKWLSPLKKLVDGKKTHDRIAWVNSPNVYQRKEILETGTRDPRIITRWIQDGQKENGQPHYEHAKIDSAHQFAPHSLDSEEFKRKQRAMKELRARNTISSGPQSQVLDGVTWNELKKQSGAETDAEGRMTSEPTIIVGAASKGIIQRDHQHDAKVYRTSYAKNPFDNISDVELEEYKRIVSRKQRGEEVPYEEIPENMRHLLTEPIMELVTSPTSPTSPLSEDESEKDKKKDKKDKDKKKRIRTPSFLKSGKKEKEEEKSERKEERKEEKRDEKREEKERKKDKEKKKDKREKERA